MAYFNQDTFHFQSHVYPYGSYCIESLSDTINIQTCDSELLTTATWVTATGIGWIVGVPLILAVIVGVSVFAYRRYRTRQAIQAAVLFNR